MTDAILGFGTLFQTESLDSPNTWSSVAEVAEFELPPLEREAVDLSHELPPASWAESEPGMLRAGQVTLKFNFVPGGSAYDDLAAEMSDQVIRSRRILFPNGYALPFDAYLIKLQPAAPISAGLAATATFQVTGEPGPLELAED
jgi:hypothetical protein